MFWLLMNWVRGRETFLSENVFACRWLGGETDFDSRSAPGFPPHKIHFLTSGFEAFQVPVIKGKSTVRSALQLTDVFSVGKHLVRWHKEWGGLLKCLFKYSHTTTTTQSLANESCPWEIVWQTIFYWTQVFHFLKSQESLSIISTQYHSVYTIVTSVTHDHLHSIIHTTNYIHIAMHHLRSGLLLDSIFYCCVACLSSCKMSNLLHGPISSNQI